MTNSYTFFEGGGGGGMKEGIVTGYSRILIDYLKTTKSWKEVKMVAHCWRGNLKILDVNNLIWKKVILKTMWTASRLFFIRILPNLFCFSSWDVTVNRHSFFIPKKVCVAICVISIFGHFLNFLRTDCILFCVKRETGIWLFGKHDLPPPPPPLFHPLCYLLICLFLRSVNLRERFK